MKIPQIFFIFPFFEIFTGGFCPLAPHGTAPELFKVHILHSLIFQN